MLPFVHLMQYRSVQPHVRFAHVCLLPLASSLGPRYIYDHEMILVTKGKGRIESERGVLDYAEGSLLLIPPGTVHRFYDAEGDSFSHIAIHFDWEPRVQEFEDLAELWAPVDEKDEDFPPVQVSLWLPHITMVSSVPEALCQMFMQVVNQYQAEDLYRNIAVQSVFLILLLVLTRKLHNKECAFVELKGKEEKPSSQLKERAEIMKAVQQLHELVKSNSPADHEFKHLCESTHFSMAHFRRLFKEQMGYAPHMYFTLLRLRKACQLLLESKLTVQEISYLCGYEDAKYFSRLFRQTEGMTPMEYRNSMVHGR